MQKSPKNSYNCVVRSVLVALVTTSLTTGRSPCTRKGQEKGNQHTHSQLLILLFFYSSIFFSPWCHSDPSTQQRPEDTDRGKPLLLKISTIFVVTMAGSKKQRTNIIHTRISVQCVLAAMVATVSLLGPGIIIHAPPASAVHVSAAKHPFAFCIIAPKSMTGMKTMKFRSHSSRTRTTGRGYNRRNGRRLRALDTVLPHPRGIPAFQGDSSDDVKNVPIILNEDIDIISSRHVMSHVDGHLEHSNVLDVAAPLQRGLLSQSDDVDRNAPNEQVLLAGAVVSFILAVATVLKLSPSGCWRYYLAGGICASTSHALTTPIDVVKVRVVSGCRFLSVLRMLTHSEVC